MTLQIRIFILIASVADQTLLLHWLQYHTVLPFLQDEQLPLDVFVGQCCTGILLVNGVDRGRPGLLHLQ